MMDKEMKTDRLWSPMTRATASGSGMMKRTGMRLALLAPLLLCPLLSTPARADGSEPSVGADVKNGFDSAGHAIVRGAHTAGHAIVNGAHAVGHAAQTGGQRIHHAFTGTDAHSKAGASNPPPPPKLPEP
jgi:hypothetical protein